MAWEQLKELIESLIIVHNAPVITGIIFVLTFQILLTSISRCLPLLNFLVSFVSNFISSGVALSTGKVDFSFFHAVVYQVDLLVFEVCDNNTIIIIIIIINGSSSSSSNSESIGTSTRLSYNIT